MKAWDDKNYFDRPPVSDDENPLLLKKKKPVYVQGELFPLEKESMIGKAKKWWDSLKFVPHVTVRNLSDPFGDKGYEGGTKSGIEVGIRIRF